MTLGLRLLIILMSLGCFAQAQTNVYRSKKVAVKDSIRIDSFSINPKFFKIVSKSNQMVDSSTYTVDFSKGMLYFKDIALDTVIIEYLRYPTFLTKTYKLLDESIILDNTDGLQRLYSLQQDTRERNFTPFDGLTTSGSISRGVTVGNNQNSVLNSELDLQISGKLSDKVTLRASIQDANIPLQESGYSQRLDEFDQVFIELESNDWRIRAGDIDLINTNSYFNSFSKRVQGLFVNANLSEKTNAFASGALVRGQFTTSQFIAQEGNQGPYKLRGPNNELFVLIVSGSETVYVNGIPVKRGENEDYIIDYNAGELLFNSTFPITSEMRITVDYQFTDRNYSRFIVYGGSGFDSEKLKLNVSVYSESDAKNQPLQQNLSPEQVAILAQAGDDRSQMVAPSAQASDFSENRILYRKEVIGTDEVFVFSNDPEDELFIVTFSPVGDNQGNYVVSSTNAVSTIYEYVAPIAGIPQGNFEPVVQLIAPVRLQLATLSGLYQPTEKTQIDFELSGSKNDVNLFSNIDDNDNNGFAGKLKIEQALIKADSSWSLNGIVDMDYIHSNFVNIQRLYRPEFNRDWNLEAPEGNQILFNGGFQLIHPEKGIASYNFEHLNYSENYNGNRHNLLSELLFKNLNVFSKSSFLKAESSLSTSDFFRSFNRVVYGKNKAWIGAKLATESNEQIEKQSQIRNPISQRFVAYEGFLGVGDSTAVFTEIGYKHRVNDSLRNNELTRVNVSNTYILKSRIIQNQNTTLQLFANYRRLQFKEEGVENQTSLNSRLNYNQKLFKSLLISNMNFETNSGTLPQQEFTYVAVESGQGAYTWNDYNGNGIQELDEFEMAQFQDQGQYIRVLLPNRVFVQTHQNRYSHTLTFNPQSWSVSESKSQKFWSHFYNQAAFLVDHKERRSGSDFNLNPFKALSDSDADRRNRLGLNVSLRNVLFFNRGKQKYTTSYTFLTNKTQNLLATGSQQNSLKSHQLNFNHKFWTYWLITVLGNFETNESLNENFVSRNFEIETESFQPKLSYLFGENAQFDVFYTFTSKSNTIGNLEQLNQTNYGLSFNINKSQKLGLIGEFNVFKNDYQGNANSPVAYQMLEGLQPGTNFTWSLLFQKKLTTYLDLNLSYLGRKSETSKTIHTGTVQLKAYF